jgi:hypothetical protein
MATYTVNKGKHATLGAATVDTVNVSSTHTVEVLNRGAADIYFTIDGSVPTVGGDDTYIAPAGQPVVVTTDESRITVVKLISASNPAYSVMGF